MPQLWSTIPTRARRASGALARVVAEHGDAAGGAGAVALEDLDGGRLARPVGPEQAEHLAAADLGSRSRAPPRARRRPCAGRRPGWRSPHSSRAQSWQHRPPPHALRVHRHRHEHHAGARRRGARRAAHRGAAAAARSRASARACGPTARSPPEKIAEVAERRRRAVPAGRRARRGAAARGRDGRHPRRRQPRRVRRRRRATGRAWRSRCSTARPRRGWPSSARRGRSGGRSTGGWAWSTSAAARAELAVGTRRRRGDVVGVVPGRLRPARRPPPALGPAAGGRARARPPRRAPRAFAGLAPPAPDVAVAVGGSAASLRRLVGAVLEPASLERALGAAVGRAGRAGRAPARARRGARPAAAGRHPGPRRRLAALRAAAARSATGGIREGVLLELAAGRGATATSLIPPWPSKRHRHPSLGALRGRRRAHRARAHRRALRAGRAACSTRATSSACTTCGSPRGACAPCSRSSRRASRTRPFKDVLRDVKALADALGERRDPDVHIDAMEAFAEQVLATQRTRRRDPGRAPARAPGRRQRGARRRRCEDARAGRAPAPPARRSPTPPTAAVAP